jgi:hypothetical protein
MEHIGAKKNGLPLELSRLQDSHQVYVPLHDQNPECRWDGEKSGLAHHIRFSTAPAGISAASQLRLLHVTVAMTDHQGLPDP